MISEILGIALAFASIMLLFSMITTTLVQAIQATVDLRYRNLKQGVLKITDLISGIDRSKLEAKIEQYLYYRTGSNSGNKIGILDRLLGIRKTEVTEDQLAGLLESEFKSQCADIDKQVRDVFSDLEQYMSKRYQRFMHTMSIIFGLMIAVAFQLNSFDLLLRLSADPAMRETYIKMATELQQKEGNVQAIQSYQDIEDSILQKLKQKYPKEQEIFQRLKPLDKDTHSVQNPLADSEKGVQIKSEYESLLQQKLIDREQKVMRTVDDLSAISARYNFSIKGNLSAYYLDKDKWLSNIIGTIVSGILISLGAPFWFNAIRRIASLRDRSAKRAEST